MPRVAVVGVPTNSSGNTRGVALAPKALRAHGLMERLSSVVEVLDMGDLRLPDPVPVRGPSGLLAEDALISMIEAVRNTTDALRTAGDLPLLVGGDCPVLLGAVASLQLQHEHVGLVFIDGHEDAWPPEASPTGEAADCEMGLALGLADERVSPALRVVLPRLRPEDVVMLGPRDADELRRSGVASLDGIVRAFRRPGALEDLPPLSDLPPWWLHVDLDVLSSEALSAVDYQQPGGLTWSQLHALSLTCIRSPGFTGCSVCIYNPELDPHGQGAERIVDY